jgi:DNA-binding transcriptional LysR family regulator
LAFPTTIVSTYSTLLRHHLVATAGFITVLPKPMFEIMAKGLSIKALPVHLPTPRRTVVLVILKRRTLSSIAQLFIETLRAVAKPQTKTRKNGS